METIDLYPTHEYEGFKLRAGRPFPFGATFVPGGVNFSVFSSHATSCTLVLFEKGQPQPIHLVQGAGQQDLLHAHSGRLLP